MTRAEPAEVISLSSSFSGLKHAVQVSAKSDDNNPSFKAGLRRIVVRACILGKSLVSRERIDKVRDPRRAPSEFLHLSGVG
jgi:hypothetical protein